MTGRPIGARWLIGTGELLRVIETDENSRSQWILNTWVSTSCTSVGCAGSNDGDPSHTHTIRPNSCEAWKWKQHDERLLWLPADLWVVYRSLSGPEIHSSLQRHTTHTYTEAFALVDGDRFTMDGFTVCMCEHPFVQLYTFLCVSKQNNRIPNTHGQQKQQQNNHERWMQNDGRHNKNSGETASFAVSVWWINWVKRTTAWTTQCIASAYSALVNFVLISFLLQLVSWCARWTSVLKFRITNDSNEVIASRSMFLMCMFQWNKKFHHRTDEHWSRHIHEQMYLIPISA